LQGGVHFSNILEDPKIHCYFVILFIVNPVRYNETSKMAESLNIGQLKITANEKEEFQFGDHFANVLKKLENFWKEEKYCDVTLVAGADGKR